MIQNSAFLWLTHTALYMGLTSLVAGIKQHKCSGFKSLIIPFVFFSSLSSVYFFVVVGGVFLKNFPNETEVDVALYFFFFFYESFLNFLCFLLIFV